MTATFKKKIRNQGTRQKVTKNCLG